jgi:hypothetical protein
MLLSGISPAKDLAPYGDDTFFDPSHLVKVDIRIDSADWDTMRMQHRSVLRTFRTDIPPSQQEKQFDYFEANLTIDGTDLGRVTVRKKGFVGSMDRQRPSLKIKIDEFDKKKSFAGVDTLTLNNNKQDPSAVSQVFAFQLFRQFGLPASRCNLAVVTVNGESLGVYTNVESLDKRFARRKFGNDKGALYEGTVADFEENELIRFERKFGKKQMDRRLEKVVVALNADDDLLLEKVAAVVDLDQFYRFWAMESLLGHWDGYVSSENNFFIYFNPATERIAFIPWGLDQLGKDTNWLWPNFVPPKSVKAAAALPRRLYQVEAARDAYFATMQELLASVWKEDELIALIRQLEDMIEPYRVDTGRDWHESSRRMTTFIAGRRADVERELNGPHPEWTLPPVEPLPPVERRGECEIKFRVKMADTVGSPNTFLETSGDAEVAVVLDGKKLPFGPASFSMKQGRRKDADSLTLQITRPDGGDGFPSTFEITFPKSPHPPQDPYRIDAFASPAEGRLLQGSGEVDDRGSVAALTGTLDIAEFGTEPGNQVSGTIVGEFFTFIPK